LQAQSYKRNHLQLLAEILDLCRKPQVENRVINETKISSRLLHSCLEQLINQNMIELHYRKRTYSTTTKGLKYLQLLEVLQD
jgi:predicted transcriptional regulator